MKIKKKKDFTKIPIFADCRVKYCGLTTELSYFPQASKEIYIKNIDKNHYINLKTNEILEKLHITNRSEDVRSLRRSIANLRDIINTNIDDVFKCKWITLTYAENMTNTKKLYKDYEKFFKRFKYHFKDYKIEYIAVAEPQGRGAWHLHCIFIFDKNPGFIDNSIISKIWGNGFVTTRRLEDVDNVGLYLTAYLTDLPIEDLPTIQDIKLAEEIIDHHNGPKTVNDKKYLKGARLYMYPPKFNLYRCSRGIKKPLIKDMRYDIFLEERKKEGFSSIPSFSKTIIIKLDNGQDVFITHNRYNNYISCLNRGSQALP